MAEAKHGPILSTMSRFLEICLLVLLDESGDHGYALAERLSVFGYEREELHIGTLYKALRSLERAELVSSRWEDGLQGPRRRSYSITAAGVKELGEWMGVLEKRRARIDSVLKIFGKAGKKKIRKEA